MAIPAQIRIQAAAMKAIYALPRPIRRLIAGKQIERDGQQLALDVQVLLRMQQLSGTSLVHSSLDVERSRAGLDVSRHLVSGPPIQPVAARDVMIPADHGDLPARLYTPQGLAPGSPMLVFYHGGGFVLGTRDSHDNTARFLAKQAGVRVLSVEYRLAPEHPFPAAQEDALTAFDFAHAKASDLGADPDRIAVGGDSAGGNLAAVTALVTTRRGGPAPAFQLLLYPTTDGTTRRRSRELFADGFFLTDEHMDWFIDKYAPEGVDRSNPLLSPLLAEDHSGLPPAFVVTAGFDPLRDEGEAYAAKLAEAGVPVGLSRQEDLIHGFVNFLGIGTRFREATAEAAGALRMGLSGYAR